VSRCWPCCRSADCGTLAARSAAAAVLENVLETHLDEVPGDPIRLDWSGDRDDRRPVPATHPAKWSGAGPRADRHPVRSRAERSPSGHGAIRPGAGRLRTDTARSGPVLVSADEPIRAEVVAALASTSTANLPAVLAEHLPTPAELHAVADCLADLARSELSEAGYADPSVSVLDLSLNDLECLAAAWGIVGKWRSQQLPGTRTLGAVLKILPPDVVTDCLRVLTWGRLVPDDP
jgi:hypothetical protein